MMETSMPPVSGCLFEGLFIRGLKASGSFLEALRAAGFDPDRPQPQYSQEVWARCIDVGVRHAFPDATTEEAELRLGRALASGFMSTLVGSASTAALPRMPVELIIEQLPRFMSTAGERFKLNVTAVGTQVRRVQVKQPDPRPNVMVGALRQALEQVQAIAQVELEHADDQGYTLLVKT